MVIEYSYFVQSIRMFGFIEIIVNNISQQAFKGCDYVSLEALTFGTFIT
jgi:ubiquinone/menaquinone biosynthesis C-methylase UbiE